MIISRTGYCSVCKADNVFRLVDDATELTCWDCATPEAEARFQPARYEKACAAKINDFFCEGHEVTQLRDEKTGKNPVVTSKAAYQRLLEKNGLDPATGTFRPYSDGGFDFN